MGCGQGSECSGVWTMLFQCVQYTTRCTECSGQCSVRCVQYTTCCTECSGQCSVSGCSTLHAAQSALDNAMSVCAVHYTLHRVLWTMFCQWVQYATRCTECSAQCSVRGCSTLHAAQSARQCCQWVQYTKCCIECTQNNGLGWMK